MEKDSGEPTQKAAGEVGGLREETFLHTG